MGLYMSFDVSCETGDLTYVEPCLQKGDLIFITDANWGKTLAEIDNKDFFGGGGVNSFTGAGYADTTDLYTVTKIWKAEEGTNTATREDKFRITVDKSINWDGSAYADPDGDSTSNTGNDGHLYVRVAVLQPWALQRRRRALRVLQGL